MVAAPASYNFADVWEMAADALGDKEALVVGDERRTYAQLEERANRLAHHLLETGVGPGDHVGLYLENCRRPPGPAPSLTAPKTVSRPLSPVPPQRTMALRSSFSRRQSRT